MTSRNLWIIAFALAGCSGAAAPPASNGHAGRVEAPAPADRNAVEIPPNTGTAPDWLATCMNEAHRAFGLGYDAIHIDRQIVDGPNGMRIAEGHYDVPERRMRYRCLVDRNDRFVRIENLRGSAEPPDGR